VTVAFLMRSPLNARGQVMRSSGELPQKALHAYQQLLQRLQLFFPFAACLAQCHTQFHAPDAALYLRGHETHSTAAM
jgi:hypothetical protein